jgi:hypothetical protein
VLALTTAAFPLLALYAAVSEEHARFETSLALLYALAVVPMGIAIAVGASGLRQAPASLVAVALLLAAAPALAPLNESYLSATVSSAGEAMFLGFFVLAGALWVARLPFSKGGAVAAAVAGVLVLAGQLANGPTTNILFLWSLGMTGGLPFVLYVAAAAALSYAAWVLLREGSTMLALGLLLLALGGIGLHNTYQSTLQILGLCVLLLAVFQPASGPARAEATAEQ